jgi:adenylate cyclase
MAIEIERKYLVNGHAFKPQNESIKIIQGYLCRMKNKVVRVRKWDNQAFITVKGRSNRLMRVEFEYEIPMADADYMLGKMCNGKIVEKIRHIEFYSGTRWEIDEFLGKNEGLFLAEVELEHPGASFAFPPWLGVEVTNDPRYLNSNLVNRPFKSW